MCLLLSPSLVSGGDSSDVFHWFFSSLRPQIFAHVCSSIKKCCLGEMPMICVNVIQDIFPQHEMP